MNPFSNLSKAYDRIDKTMLKMAMQRLKFPDTLINIILDLFTNRTNSVFTEFGLTDPYDVQIGIDQEEVISPLLWCIYYDPFLSEINNLKLGYSVNYK